MKRRARLKCSLQGRNLQHRVACKTPLFWFKWETFQPSSSLASLPPPKITAIAASEGQNSGAESVPTATDLSLARFCQSCSRAQEAYLARRPPEPLPFGQQARGVLLLLTFAPYDFIVCCRGLCQDLHWVTSPLSDFLLCVIRLSQTLNCHWPIRGGRDMGGRQEAVLISTVETALMLKLFYIS